jgi:predicted PurR-regulated permease PerM
MPSPKSKTSATEALAILSTVALTSFVFAMLYFARAVLIPLALAALLTFLLAPLVSRIERWLGRVAAPLRKCPPPARKTRATNLMRTLSFRPL